MVGFSQTCDSHRETQQISLEFEIWEATQWGYQDALAKRDAYNSRSCLGQRFPQVALWESNKFLQKIVRLQMIYATY